MKIVTSSQMREMDRETVDSYHIPALLLTEHAAFQVVEEMKKRFGPLCNKSILVFCGKGNNGGDGLAIARQLRVSCGAQVTVWLLAPASSLRDDVALNYEMAEACGVIFSPTTELNFSQCDFLIDALFGTGLKGTVVGEAAQIIEAINSSGKPVIAVDIPSGLDSDTGQILGVAVRADLTVTFVLPKYGQVVYPGANSVGELVVANIGTPCAVTEAAQLQTYLTQASDVREVLPLRINGRDTNKGSFGHVVAFAGSVGFTGAPILVAEAAARAGAGLITLAIPESIQSMVGTHVSPVVMPHGLQSSSEGTFGMASLDTALQLTQKATAVAIGPGLGTGDDVSSFVRELISHCFMPLVIDADALNSLSKLPDRGQSIIQGRSTPVILTPHPGELGRLLGLEIREIESDRKSAVTRAAQFYGCVVVLKGSRTLIADREGHLYINTTGNPGMSTGGSGDVLTGVIAALLAQHLSPLAAAFAGVYIHGVAGELAALSQQGTLGLIATDLISHLPHSVSRCSQLSA